MSSFSEMIDEAANESPDLVRVFAPLPPSLSSSSGDGDGFYLHKLKKRVSLSIAIPSNTSDLAYL